jgi:hypothetical protein
VPVADTAREAAKTAKSSTRSAAKTATSAAGRAKKTTKESAVKAAATAKATRAARAGKVEEAKDVAADARLGDGLAASAIADVEALHYQVEVNKKRLNVATLTDALNDRWANGWRLAHVFEQRGNTVLVFEKRTP